MSSFPVASPGVSFLAKPAGCATAGLGSAEMLHNLDLKQVPGL